MADTKDLEMKTSRLLSKFGAKDVFVRFVCFPSEKIGAKERKALRRKLFEQIKRHIPKDMKNSQEALLPQTVTDLEKRPEHPFASVSLSHSSGLGAFVFVGDKSRSIGFDVERAERVTEKPLMRVACGRERQKAPSLALLWTAKEAGLKSLAGQKQKLFLKDCLVLNWEAIESLKQGFRFKCLHPPTGQKAFGASQNLGEWAVAYAETQTKTRG